MLPSYQSVQYISDGKITSISCSSTINNGALTAGILASSVNSIVSYTGGDGGTFNMQIVSSTGVTGLTATLTEGTFMIGNGSLTFIISGTPAGTGTANFTFSIGGMNCILRRIVYCSNTITAIVNVTNPITGKIWMDRNLGATQAATSSDDVNSWGDLYQWGRSSDGHQCRNSPVTFTLSTTDQSIDRGFIIATSSPLDWRDPQNLNLWQGVNGINNPCPVGYRLPTYAELDAERASWISNDGQGAFASHLKWSQAGNRAYYGPGNGMITGFVGCYWSSSVNGTSSYFLIFYNTDNDPTTIDAKMVNRERYLGKSVRCIKN